MKWFLLFLTGLLASSCCRQHSLTVELTTLTGSIKVNYETVTTTEGTEAGE